MLILIKIAEHLQDNMEKAPLLRKANQFFMAVIVRPGRQWVTKGFAVPLVFIALIFWGCSSNEEPAVQERPEGEKLSIFLINDPHGKLHNFGKIQQIVDEERSKNTVMLVCSGDIFSGNPSVDFHEDKGFPIVDLMNRTGFDVCALGNHEFDYGQDVLANRMKQAEFKWVCANVDVGNTSLPQPPAYTSIERNGLKVTFLGLLETNGKRDGTIPSTHPWRVENLIFSRPESVVAGFADVKQKEDADLYVALTHLGHDGGSYAMGDYQLAADYPYFDMILGGHSHARINTVVNNIPVFQAGSNLGHMGRIKLEIKDRKVQSIQFELIDLDAHTLEDETVSQLAEQYDSADELEEVVGYAQIDHSQSQLGCFYTDALRIGLGTDMSFQNTGGVRSGIDMGDVTKRGIYQMDPFNNGAVIYQMTIGEIKSFLAGSGSGFYYSGMTITQTGNSISIWDADGNELPDNLVQSVGINDYVPAVHDAFFPADPEILDKTTAEVILHYLTENNDQINYPDCERYFRFQQ
jgi:5'-nucleotidase/UDP-sugar diphosphatase